MESKWRLYAALDGGELDGLIGAAGILTFDWPSKEIHYQYYDGVSAGHNPSVSPDGKTLLLGNFSQQIVKIDAQTLEPIERFPTHQIEETDFNLQSPTHFVWDSDDSVLCIIGKHLYRVNVKTWEYVPITRHNLNNPHEIRQSSDGRFVIMSDLGFGSHDPNQIGVFDIFDSQDPRVISLPGTVWHVATHPSQPLGYAATYTFNHDPGDRVEWAPAYAREYLFEIGLATGKVRRVFSTDAEYPIHLNSDIDVTDSNVYIASGGSHTAVEVSLADFSTNRTVKVLPGLWGRFWQWRQRLRNILGALSRKNYYTSTHHLLSTYQVTGWRSFDGVYATRVSPDGKYVVAINRGYNYLRVMDRTTLKTVYEKRLPKVKGLHLGVHHSQIVSL